MLLYDSEDNEKNLTKNRLIALNNIVVNISYTDISDYGIDLSMQLTPILRTIGSNNIVTCFMILLI